MKIKFTEYQNVEGEKGNGDVWKAYTMYGSKIEDGTEWKSGNIFDNKFNTDIIKKLRRLEAGDKVDVKHTKNGKFWNVSDIVPLSEEEAVPYEGNPTKKSSGGTRSQGAGAGGTSDKMSKAEWAAKDRATKESIARAVALKVANDNTKVGSTANAIMKNAKEFLPYLLDEEDFAGDAQEDPLDAGV